MKSSCSHRKMMLKMVCYQLIVMIIMSLGFWVYRGPHAGLSALIGAGIAFFPMFLFGCFFLKTPTRRASEDVGRSLAQRVLQAFYLAECFKWVLTVLLFCLALQWKDLQALPLLLSFIVTQSVYWLMFLT